MKQTLRFFSLSVFALVVCLLVWRVSVQSAPPRTLLERLGYPADAKLLIIHGDDIGVSHSVNQASFDAFKNGAISSGSIMVPCPWFPEVVRMAKANPRADLGIHLTLTSEWPNFRWGPLAREGVASLIDPTGYMYPDVAGVVVKGKPEDAEREMRAQIDLALKSGLTLTHLDSHMGTVFSPQFFPVYMKLAKEYRLPFFVVRTPEAPPALLAMLGENDIVLDSWAMARGNVKAEAWAGFYEKIIRDLKPGVSELIVHLGYNDAELQAVMSEAAPFASAWRQRDYDVLTSSRFKQVLKENNVKLIGWADLKKLL